MEVRFSAVEDAIEEMNVWALGIQGKLYFWVLGAELRPLTSYSALKKELGDKHLVAITYKRRINGK